MSRTLQYHRPRSAATARIAALLALLALAIAGCGGGAGGGAGALPQAGSIDVAAARAFIAGHPEALVLDVRSPGEWNDDVGHIEGARLIPIGELPARLGEIEAWKDKPVVAVCRVGVRSYHAAQLLARAGFRDARNLEGGMVAWRRAGF
jgi:rhodanese-related sulfurtransferase